MMEGSAKDMSKFNKQVAQFKNLGDVTDDYLKKIQVMRSSVKRFNSVIFNFCEKGLPGLNNFRQVLLDSEDLYSLLEYDVGQLERGFNDFCTGFHLVTEARESRKNMQDELKRMREYVQIVSDHKRVHKEEKQKAIQLLEDKQNECLEMEEVVLERIDTVQRRQNEFLLEHYKKFISAHMEFHKDCITVQEILFDSIQNFLPIKDRRNNRV